MSEKDSDGKAAVRSVMTAHLYDVANYIFR